MTRSTVITAAHVAPMDQPIIDDAAVACTGDRITAVGPRDRVLSQHAPGAEVIDAGNAVILPGLVNAHTHLELSACRSDEDPGGSFVDWIVSLPARVMSGGADRDEAFARGVREGIAQCLRFGVTTVGDISQQFHLSRPILRDAPLRVVSYGETLGLGEAQPRFEMLLEGAADTQHQTDRLRIGLTPHSPYTVDRHGYRKCLDIARSRRIPLTTHLAETPAETEFLLHRSGPFRDLWESLGQWRDDIPILTDRPVPMARSLGLLDYPTLLAHVNYCDHADIALLSAGKASVVWCPRTHRYFGHPPHRWREMLRAGVNVAVGTDSCASSPDLNLLDDLRLVHRSAPDFPPHQLFQMVTTRAAAALQWSDALGSLTPGKRADMAIFPVASTDPLRELLDGTAMPAQVWIGGERVMPADKT